jgi:hypothetical protein
VAAPPAAAAATPGEGVADAISSHVRRGLPARRQKNVVQCFCPVKQAVAGSSLSFAARIAARIATGIATRIEAPARRDRQNIAGMFRPELRRTL